MRIPIFGSFVLSCVLFAAQSAMAFPEWGDLRSMEPPSDQFGPADDFDYEGIVALSGCSGSLVRFEDSFEDDFAMILTNGHCVSLIRPGVVLSDQNSSRRFTLLNPDSSNAGTVTAQKLLYATMTKTDMAIYLLKESYAKIKQRYGIDALTMASQMPLVDDPIEIISGYWKRGYRCSVEAIAYEVLEGGWTFEDSVRYSRPGCEVIGGTSGSPVLLAGTRTVVAVNNSINERGGRCQTNNPCERDEQGNLIYEKGYGYAQQTYWVYSCRDENGDIDLNQESCLLPK